MVNIEKSSYMQNDDDIGRRLPTLVVRERLKSAVVLSVIVKVTKCVLFTE